LFRPEIMVERPLRDAGRRQDLVQADAREALAEHDGLGGVENVLPDVGGGCGVHEGG
ncbi:hypothetical protein BMAFMH_E0634, partial [Burkholderia mallei FMH]